MSEKEFKPGDDVFTLNSRGTVIDIRATAADGWVYGVEDINGAVTYFTGGALRLAAS